MKTLIHLTTAADPGFSWVLRKTSAGLRRHPLLLLAMALVAFGAASARASDPVGVYALVEKVVLEPNDTAPDKIQIWGAFAQAKGSGYTYETAKRGYLYFTVNAKKKEVCLKEWADLKSVAGTKQVIGFGSRYEAKGAIRKSDDKPANPDAYPLGFGLSKPRDKEYQPVKELLALAEPKKNDAAK